MAGTATVDGLTRYGGGDGVVYIPDLTLLV
jgi:hypothetical protein